MPCPICPNCDGPYAGPPRSGITVNQEEAVRADQRYYVTADRSRIVDEGDPEAAILLAAEGDDISNEDVKRYGLDKPKAKAEEPTPEPEAKAEEPADAKAKAEEPADAKAKSGPPENKAQSKPKDK